MIDYQFHEWPNGLRLVYKQVPTTRIVHCGLILDIGSRDENESQQGMAHFWEHMAFRGTKKRKAFHILNGLESVGGELNAFTTKEYTCIYTSFLNTWYSRAAELLADIIFNSTFPAREMRKEKDVIIEEINSYKDSPSELIYDDFEAALFKGHTMGQSILGSEEHVKAIRKTDIASFFNSFPWSQLSSILRY